MKQGLTIAGVALLGVLAIAGWTRQPGPAFAAEEQLVTTQAASRAATPVVQRRAVTPVRYVESQPAPARRAVVRKRPTKHSVMIVAGSAGTGAAIGALAGGGKGAAIGALAGGAGGFIYDRLTHKKTEEY